MRHIIVATDGSEGADRAVDVAAELAKAFGGKLFIVTVAGNLSGEENCVRLNVRLMMALDLFWRKCEAHRLAIMLIQSTLKERARRP